MKFQFIEHPGCFAIEMTAETMAEAKQLTRFGVNHTKKIRHAAANVHDGFHATIVLGKNRRPTNDIPCKRG